MMKYTTLIVTLVASVLTAESNQQQERVTNGVSAASGDFPYIVSVVVGDGSGHRCGGFIYSQEWIITSASCVEGLLPSELSVVVAQVNLITPDPDELVYPIYRVFPFDGYVSTTKLHDIALLQTASKITFGPNVNLIYYDEAEESTSITGTFAGWGATMVGGLYSSRLRWILVTFGSDCQVYGADEFYPIYMICAGDSAVDAGSPCQFDEGSPLVQDLNGVQKVVGIMSKNAGCGTDFKPTIYTRLYPYFPWFDKIAGPQPILP